MNISFYLNTQLKTRHGDHPVYMYITYNGKRIRKPVNKVHANSQYWDDLKQRIKRPAKADPLDETKSFNKRLEFIEAQVKLIDQEAFDRRIKLTEKYIIDRLMDESLVKIDQFDFFKAADQYLQSIKSVKAERTITGKRTVFNFLKEYQDSTGNEITFHQMNVQFFEELRHYAFEKKKIGDNYFAKIIAVLKTFLHWSFERDYIKHESFKKFQAPERENEIICLTLEELMALCNHTFKSKRLDRVRDVFVFGCSTGLRFSDLVSLKPSNIQGDFIVINIQKTRENSVIPLNKFSAGILEKYKDTVYETLPKVSHQKFNSYLKECCKEAGIDTIVTITRFSGGHRQTTAHPKYELITSHAARKTFATLSLLMGMPERVVRNITGHKKEESFKRYVNFTKEYEKQQMNKVWDSM
ncbi:MAG: site-specific integrase [Cyclobacteriaceae bacterium]|nr:site-specific integrase [Cyclobacteriaceae bacterium]